MFFTKEYEYVTCINNVFNFFYLKKGILYKKINNNIEELFNDVFKFSVCMDALGNINIGIVNFFGEIIYVRYKNDMYIKNRIDIYNIPIKEFKDIRIYVHDDMTNIIVVKKNTNKNDVLEIIHYFIIDNKINKYKVGEFFEYYEGKLYETDIDINGNIHLVYRSKNNLNHVFYKMFNNRYNNWSIPEKINNNKEIIKEFSLLCDTKGSIHITLYSFEFDGIKVDYLVKDIRRTYTLGFKKRESIKKILGGLIEAFLIQIDDVIKIIWNQNNKFYKLNIDEYSVDNIDLEYNKKLIPIIYIGNKYKDFKSIKTHMYYRYLQEEVDLLGINRKKMIDKNLFRTINYKYESIDALKEEAVGIDDINNIKNSIINYSNDIKDYLNNNIDEVFIDNQESIICDYKEHYSYKITRLKNDIEYMKKRETKFIEILDKMNENYENLESKFNDFLKAHEDIKSKEGKTNLISKIKSCIWLNKKKG
ncbi:hypothetical protein [Tepidibacter mesophilus]|uniref:hypothetical protein n=1 Tax=Tepidibacter mesophilus TaxID=655607 RepID=UPI000C08A45E|nr:hypothetical protein [Tepidibacter mesophilus]